MLHYPGLQVNAGTLACLVIGILIPSHCSLFLSHKWSWGHSSNKHVKLIISIFWVAYFSGVRRCQSCILICIMDSDYRISFICLFGGGQGWIYKMAAPPQGVVWFGNLCYWMHRCFYAIGWCFSTWASEINRKSIFICSLWLLMGGQGLGRKTVL